MKECFDPIFIPELTSGQKISQLEVERHWSTDRRNLIECGESKTALINFYQDRDKRIQAR